MIKRGDVVRIRSEWADSGDDEITFMAIDDAANGRVPIQALLGLNYNPVQIVNVNMIVKTIDQESIETN